MSDYPIITPKQRTAAKDFIGSNCEMFFPMDEGSGDIITDIANGYQFTKATIDHTLPHAVTQNFGNADRSGSKTLAIDGKKHILVFMVGKVLVNNTLFNISFGSPTDFNLNLSGAGFGSTSSAGASTAAAMATIAANDIVLIAGTFNKDTAELRSYHGLNGATVLNENTTDASVHLPEMDKLSNVITLGNTLAQGLMAGGLLLLNSLPAEADLLEMLEVTHQNIINGRKWYDPRLSNY